MIVPAGLERFFQELGELAAQAPPDVEERRAQLGIDYKLSFVPEWIPELKEQYGLKMLGD